MAAEKGWSKTWTFFERGWHEGKVPVMGRRTDAWLCSVAFDGARVFEGVPSDLALHCAHVNASPSRLYLKPTVTAEEWIGLAREGVREFDTDATLYVRPMYWADKEGPWVQAHEGESTNCCLSIYETPAREPRGFSTTISPFRQPTLETMPVDAKAGCLYPNNSSSLFETRTRGFSNTLVCDMPGNVTELATSNITLTPLWRSNLIIVWRVVEKTLNYQDFEKADEIVSTGNYSKAVPETRIGDRLSRSAQSTPRLENSIGRLHTHDPRNIQSGSSNAPPTSQQDVT